MDRSSVITLIGETRTQDSIRQWISTETPRQVYCDVRSVTREEWFEAGRNGLQPVYVFVMFEPDYQGEKIVEYNGKRYGIYRTYRGRNEQIFLYAEEKGGLKKAPAAGQASGSTEPGEPGTVGQQETENGTDPAESTVTGNAGDQDG